MWNWFQVIQFVQNIIDSDRIVICISPVMANEAIHDTGVTDVSHVVTSLPVGGGGGGGVNHTALL